MSELRFCRCGSELQPKQRSYCSERCSKDGAKSNRLVATYGITLEKYNELLDYQGGGCAICGRPPAGRRYLVVDHEHDGGPSGKIRGLLCNIPCNLKTVAKHKNGKELRAAADYLDDPPAERLWGKIIAPGRKKKKRKAVGRSTRPRRKPKL